MPDVPPPADLLAHAGFVRSVARSLLSDDAAADDVAQDALVAAIERPPRERRSLRAWLSTVVGRAGSNARRGESRRLRRERAAARPEATPSAADLAGRAEILRVVADAVASLEPGPRRLVLLRHYEGLPPREIAARLRVPVETVHSGLSRAHARLRTRLDERERGNVEGWRAGLAGLVGVDVAKTGAPVGAGIAAGTAAKAAAGVAAAACVVAGVAWAVLPSSPAGAPPASVGAGTPADPAESARLAARAPPAGAGAPRPPWTPSGRAPVLPGWERRSLGRIQLDVPQGWSEQPGPSPGSATWAPIRPDDPRIAFGVVPADVAATSTRGERTATRTVLVDERPAKREEYARKDRVGVVVSFAAGDASAPAVVLVMTGPKPTWEADRVVLERILGSVRVLPEAAPVGPGTETEEPAVGYLDSLATPVTGPAVEGVVLRGARPAAGVAVELAAETRGEPKPLQRAVTTADGVFRFEGVERGAYVLDVQGGSDTRVRVHTALVPDVPRTRLIVVLGTGSIEGVAYDRMGKRAAGERIDAWAYRTDARRDEIGTVTGRDGSFRIEGLHAGLWHVTLRLPGPGLADVHAESVELQWGEKSRIDVGSPLKQALVRGRVRSAGGASVAGPGAYATFQRIGGTDTVTVPLDAEGRYRQRLPAGDYEVRVSGLAAATSHATTHAVDKTDLEIDVTLEAPSLLGRVWDLATNRPVAPGEWSALVVLEGLPGGATMTGTAPDGTFALHGVPAGSYRMHAFLGPPGARRVSEEVVVEVAEARDVLDLRLDLPAK